MKTKIFCDSADLKTIKKLNKNPLVNGFTTNPSLMRLAGAKDYKKYSLKLLSVCKSKSISLEVFGDTYDQMLRQANIINSWGKNIYVKIPVVNSKGFFSGRVINTLSKKGIKLNITAVYTAKQVSKIIKSINKLGICDETMWPYDISKFTEKPSENCYKFAKSHHSLLYRRVYQSISTIINALNEGYPVVFGFAVYESFEGEEVAKTGIMPMPKENEKLLGGHAVAVVGYCNKQKHFIIRNSWGEEWGDKGYFYMPYKFITNPQYANDFWTVERITQK